MTFSQPPPRFFTHGQKWGKVLVQPEHATRDSGDFAPLCFCQPARTANAISGDSIAPSSPISRGTALPALSRSARQSDSRSLSRRLKAGPTQPGRKRFVKKQ